MQAPFNGSGYIFYGICSNWNCYFKLGLQPRAFSGTVCALSNNSTLLNTIFAFNFKFFFVIFNHTLVSNILLCLIQHSCNTTLQTQKVSDIMLFNAESVRYSTVQHRKCQIQCCSMQRVSDIVLFKAESVRYSTVQSRECQIQCCSMQSVSDIVLFNSERLDAIKAYAITDWQIMCQKMLILLQAYLVTLVITELS